MRDFKVTKPKIVQNHPCIEKCGAYVKFANRRCKPCQGEKVERDNRVNKKHAYRAQEGR